MNKSAAAVDTIVVGAGSAGGVVAHRLAQNGQRVLLLEAGDWASGHPLVDHPSTWFSLRGTELDWDYLTEPAPDVAGQRFRWPRGKGVGGSSLINGMIWLRGNRLDFDAWNQAGCDGWSYEDLLPFFRRAEDWTGGQSSFHGSGGEIKVSHDPHPSLAARAFVDSAQQCGLPFNPDFNADSQFGVGFIPHTIRDSIRESVATSFLVPGRAPESLVIETGARVQRLVLSNGVCRGVEYVQGGRLKQIHAAEIILSAGTVDTPKILMLSGLGPFKDLEALGIKPVADLPVGENLQDHAAVAVCVGTDVEMEVDPRSPLGEAALFTHSRAGLSASAPDLQITLSPFVNLAAARITDERPPPSGFTIMPYVARPQSRGRVTLRSADPADPARIETGYLREIEDRRVLRRGVELTFELLAEEPLRGLASRFLQPSTRPATTADLDALIDETLFTFFHPVGTCAMGRGQRSVVDPELRVHGIAGLSVVDASVMPTLVSANTHAAVIAIAERAADVRK